MFDFGNANDAQRQAITTMEGPVLITAGPGTGKTFTLVQRMIYMIAECGVKPEEIMVATFTEKAAKELFTRITNELDKRGMAVNVAEMWVGTFHSLCLRIIKENLDYARLKTGFKVMDGFDQQYLIYRNYHFFAHAENFDVVFPKPGKWRNSQGLATVFNALSEELVMPAALQSDASVEIKTVGNLYQSYLRLLGAENLLDFPAIQVAAHRILAENPEVLASYQQQIKYLMVDEYQDTNFIQERLVFLLAGERENICVVGDDDQGLYRFRGATIRNILEFPSKFTAHSCTVIPLVKNYRSHPDVVDFYNRWMETTSGSKFKFDWGKYRYPKSIEAAAGISTSSPGVIKVSGVDDVDEWHEQVLAFIEALRDSGNLTDLNQIAFLFNSVKHPRVTALAEFLEAHGISVYSPRSAMFFERFEVKLALGCLMLMFPNWITALGSDEYHWLPENYRQWLLSCITTAGNYFNDDANNAADLARFVIRTSKLHRGLSAPTDYAFAGLLYKLFAFEPFRAILSTPMDSGMVDLRPTRNLALLTQIVGKFEYLHGVTILSPKPYRKTERSIDYFTERLFNTYLRLLFDGGIAEYEDDSEYAPSGCVSFLTIHQSKGMEFPIVVVDSLKKVPRKQSSAIFDVIAAKYYHREPFEPEALIKYFDHWRLFYTAFSRAQNLLVLSCSEDNSTPSKYIRELYDELPDWREPSVDLSEFDFKPVKDVNLKEAFSFTSHITVYETCALQYKFFKELEFQPVRVNAQLFGRLVHQTIEDVHKAALRGEPDLITAENVAKWFEMNYTYLSRAEHIYLAENTRGAALDQVQRYVERQQGDWSQIRQAEVDVSLVKPDYILDGTIDLIRGKGDTVEIVDFKSTRKPDLVSESETLEKYRRQLHIYAHLVEQRTGEKVSKMHLYYTGETDGIPMITWPHSVTAVEATVEVFDEVVHKILAKDFNHRTDKLKTCKNCDFKAYCART